MRCDDCLCRKTSFVGPVAKPNAPSTLARFAVTALNTQRSYLECGDALVFPNVAARITLPSALARLVAKLRVRA